MTELPDLRRVRGISPVLRRFGRVRGFGLSPSSTFCNIEALAAEEAKASILESETAILCRLLSLTADLSILVSVYASILSRMKFCSSILDRDAAVP